MEGLELICFQIIMNSGNARSLYIEAINDAKEYKFDDAKKKMEEASEAFNECHKIHAQLIQQEADQGSVPFQLLLLHAEDLQMSAETFGILAEQYVDLYKKIQALENNKL